ncbi:MAG: biotin--protein ligase [Lysobacter sp.]
MHGEYKVPGGKLVVVDLTVVDGLLTDVRVSGDFFLEPDSALDVINHALSGQPAVAGGGAWAEAIDRALGDGVSLYGITSAGVGIAVERAVRDGAAP